MRRETVAETAWVCAGYAPRDCRFKPALGMLGGYAQRQFSLAFESLQFQTLFSKARLRRERAPPLPWENEDMFRRGRRPGDLWPWTSQKEQTEKSAFD